jgi:ATP-binding cassette subfamily F protein 3
VMSAQPMSEETARNLLARFMFTGDEVYRRVGDLSGGERSRVALAKLTLARANFLILDEPTNHLDINAREALEDVLRDYPGTLLFVSHDRYFIDAIATNTWVVNKGRLEAFSGNYSDYQQEVARREREGANVLAPPPPQPVANGKRKGQPAAPGTNGTGRHANGAAHPSANGIARGGKAQPGTPAVKGGKAQAPAPVKQNGRGNGHSSSTVYGAARERSREVEQLEQQIEKLELRLHDLTTELGAATEQRDLASISRLGREYEQAEVELERKYKDWERLSSMAVAS